MSPTIVAMCLSGRFKFTATLLLSLAAFAFTLDTSEQSLLDDPLAMLMPQR